MGYYNSEELIDLENKVTALKEELQSKTDLLALVIVEKTGLVEENAELRLMVRNLKSAADEVTKYKYSLSYNESYAGEPIGEIKNNLAELDMVSCKAIQLLNK